jgi:hypothetical protein
VPVHGLICTKCLRVPTGLPDLLYCVTRLLYISGLCLLSQGFFSLAKPQEAFLCVLHLMECLPCWCMG